jgi:hypothetical protein
VSDPVEGDKKRKGLSAPVIGAIATVSAAVIAGIFTLIATTNSKSEPGTISGTSHNGFSSSPAPATPSRSGTATSRDGARPPIYYQGPVTVSGNGLDFDINPPNHGPATANFVYNTSALQGAGSNTVGFAVWKQGGTPTAAKCNTFVTTNLTSDVTNVTAGMKICFKTAEGRVGLLRVQQDTSANELRAIATVWGS